MESFQEFLDEMELKIEEHRKMALRLKEDRQSYEKALLTIRNSSQESPDLNNVDKEEIEAVLNRLHQRLSSVNIDLVTHRNESQSEALEKVNGKINDLVEMIHCNSPEAGQVAESYLNSCTNGTGSRFEALLLSCTSDDQKAVKERISNIVDNINAMKDEKL